MTYNLQENPTGYAQRALDKAAHQAAYEDAAYEYRAALAQEAREEHHEAHGGDEAPDTDDCTICHDAADAFMRWGVAR